MASVDVDFRQNVVSRVVSLPLVSSTYGMVSSAYIHTKENHPYLRSLCEVAEKGVLTVTAAAMTSAKPIIQKMEPQILVANNYACIGLDKIEEKLPILHQPSDKVVSRASDLVVGAKDALKITVTGAKDTVAHTLAEVFGKTQEAVHESMERTKAVVNGSINTVLRSHVLQIVHNGVDHALAKSETLVDQYLPLTEEELAEAVDTTIGLQDDTPKPNCYIRLGYLSTKVSKRAYRQAITRVRNAKSKTREAVSQLHHSIYLDVESRTLSIACSLTKQLQTTCVTLLSGVQCLPLNFQEQAYDVSTIAGDLYQKFNLVSSFREVSSLLATTKEQLDKMTTSLDDMMDYVINHTPLNWLVPDFTINDLSSESDMQDIFDLDEYYMQVYMHTNGHINPPPRAD